MYCIIILVQQYYYSMAAWRSGQRSNSTDRRFGGSRFQSQWSHTFKLCTFFCLFSFLIIFFPFGLFSFILTAYPLKLRVFCNNVFLVSYLMIRVDGGYHWNKYNRQKSTYSAKLYHSFCLDHRYCLQSKIIDLFFYVQSFISESMRFYKST